SAAAAAGQQASKSSPAQTEVFFSHNESESFLVAHAETEGSFAGTRAPLTFRTDGCDASAATYAPVSLEITATDRNTELATNCAPASSRMPTAPKLKFALAPVSPCDAFLKIDFAGACFTRPVLRFNLWDAHVRAADENAMLLAKLPPRE